MSWSYSVMSNFMLWWFTAPWGWVRKHFYFHLSFLNMCRCRLKWYRQAMVKLETVAHHHILLSKEFFLSSFWSSIANVYVKVKIIRTYLQTLLATIPTQACVSRCQDATWSPERCSVQTHNLQTHTGPLWQGLRWVELDVKIQVPEQKEDLKTQIQSHVLKPKIQTQVWRG